MHPLVSPPASNGRPRFGLTALAAGLLAAMLGCGEANRYAPPPPPEVTVSFPRQQEVVNYLEVTGTAQPIVTVEIRARVRGFLKERHFEEGSAVHQGQLLLVIDEEPFRLKLDQAKANLAEAQTASRKAEQSKAREVARAQLALDEATLLQADSNEKRLRKLIANRAVTEDELERAEATRKQAVAQVQASRARLEQAQTEYETNILAARATAAAAQTAVRNAELELSYCRMESPIDGRITDTNYDIGNLVGDGQASLLATIVQIDPIHVYMSLSETDFLRYRQQAPPPSASGAAPVADLELGLPTDDGYPHRGHVDYHDPAIEPGTGTIRLRGVFPNSTGEILPGAFARLRLPLDKQASALVVPEKALGVDQAGEYLLVVGKGDEVEYRAVKTGRRIENDRVVSGQIGPNDRVVVEGLLRARPKLKVVPVMEAQSAAAAAASQAALVSPAVENSP